MDKIFIAFFSLLWLFQGGVFLSSPLQAKAEQEELSESITEFVKAGTPEKTSNCQKKVRYSYPIVLKGPRALIGKRIEYLTAYAFVAKDWRKVAFQIDEVNASGDYVLEDGLPFTRGTDDGIFDNNDEVVFRGQDLGNSFTLSDLSKDIREGARQLWQVKICHKNGLVGHLLIVFRKMPLAQNFSFKPLVDFNKNKKEVSSPVYNYKFNSPNPVLFGDVRLHTKENGDFSILSRSGFKMIFCLPWWGPDFNLNDTDFTSEIESWQVGPVRTIVAVGVKFKKFLSLFNFHMFSELVFYENRFQIPTKIEFMFDPSKYLLPGSGLFYSVAFPENKTWKIETNIEGLPQKSAADIINSKSTALKTQVFYARAQRPEGAFYITVTVDEKVRKLVPPPFIITKRMFGHSPWTNFWGWLENMTGDLGLFIDISNVPKGTYNFGLDLVLSSEAFENFEGYDQIETDWISLPIK